MSLFPSSTTSPGTVDMCASILRNEKSEFDANKHYQPRADTHPYIQTDAWRLTKACELLDSFICRVCPNSPTQLRPPPLHELRSHSNFCSRVFFRDRLDPEPVRTLNIHPTVFNNRPTASHQYHCSIDPIGPISIWRRSLYRNKIVYTVAAGLDPNCRIQ